MRSSTALRASAAVALFADLDTPALKASLSTAAGLMAPVRLAAIRWDSLHVHEFAP